MAGGGSIQWASWDPVEGSDMARHHHDQQGAAPAAAAAAAGTAANQGVPASNQFIPAPLRTMSNAELDALLNNLAAGNAATTSSSSSSSASSMMPSYDGGQRATTAYTNQGFAAPQSRGGGQSAADAATAASTAAAVAALQANGLINPLGPASSANASAHGFDWTQPDSINAASMAGLGLTSQPSGAGHGQASSAYDSSVFAPYQGRASWDGSSAMRSSALAPGMDPQGGQGQLTPGQESSDSGGNTSSASTKRRRMTFSGVDSSHQAGRGRPPGHGSPVYQPQAAGAAAAADAASMAAQQSRRTSGGLGASPTASTSARMGSGNHLVNSRDLEAMATESLQRASAENSRSIDGAGNLSAMPPAFAPGLAHHQQQQQRQRQQSKQQIPQQRSAEDSSAGQSSSAPMASQLSASHPPGLGGTTLLRGQDGASSGAQAAHEFTRRKGWAHRVMDELLDFAHILDTQGRIIHATNSIHGITGWKAESLKGKSIFSFVHPQDIPALQKQLQRSLETGEDMLLYYRFRRNPATIAARAKTRLGVDNGAAAGGPQMVNPRANRSPSDATSSPTDSSGPTSTSEEAKPGGSRSKPRPSTVGDVDPDADWVTFEMSGHVYHVPVEVDDAEVKAEDAGNDGNNGSGGGSGGGQEEGTGSNDSETAPRPRVKKYDLPLARRPDAQCFFCSCRVYPSKGVTVLDSFLELKLENEKLRKQLEDLKIVEANGPDPAASLDQRFPRPGPSALQTAASSRGVQSADSITAVSGSYDQVPRGSGDIGVGSSSNQLSEAGLILRRKHSTSAKKKTQDAAGATSQGGGGGAGASASAGSASTGGSSTATATTASNATTAGDDDRVCTDCGRTDSPEWRKGPLGPKTLCNACGLRYAKRVKKKAQSGANLAAPPQVEPLPADEGEGLSTGGSFYDRRDSLPTPSSKTSVRVPSNGAMAGLPDGMSTPRQQHSFHQQHQHQHQMPGMLYGTSDFGGSPAASAGSPLGYGAPQRQGMTAPPPQSPYQQHFTQPGFLTQHGGGMDGMSSAYDPYQQQVAGSGSQNMFASGSNQGQQQQQHYMQQQQQQGHGHGHSSYGGQQPW